MSSLFGTMYVAVNALLANQGALETTSNNVANANTPGYSRQRAVLVEGQPLVVPPLTFGSGVVLQRIESLRDPILELRLHAETQQQGQLDALVSALNQVQVMFNDSDNALGERIAAFFNSLNQLSTDPASLSLRQAVLTAASNLGTSFHNATKNLQLQRASLDLNVGQAVSQVNVLTSQIAKLNGQIHSLENLNQEAGDFVDQRNVLIRQLSELIDVSVIQSDNGIALTTSNGTALVADQKSFDLTAQMDASGVQHVFAQGTDITSAIAGGKISGLIAARDVKIPGVLADLDTLAAGIATAENNAHRMGYDLSGNAGGDLFVPPPAGGTGAASAFALNFTDPALLAASSDGSPGSNGNLAQLAAVRNQTVAGGRTPTDFYADLVFRVGSDISNGTADLDASALVLRQLEDQRAGVSGVSLDEEAANLIRYQRAFEASARVVSTISDMTEVAVNLGRY
jgi:flagellar hook-associated protein 1